MPFWSMHAEHLIRTGQPHITMFCPAGAGARAGARAGAGAGAWAGVGAGPPPPKQNLWMALKKHNLR